jgi:glyoxylase-like metal-dependent hydrolase (beta-lactamase superfamily II)
MQIGKYEVHAVETANFGLDGGAMFGIVPKPLWEKTNPADEKNRINLTGRCLLLKSPDRTILIDTGIGSGWDEKFSKIYGIDNSKNTLENSLSKLGLSREDISDVILTHLHFDHTGGAVVIQDGKPEPAFPNAKYYVQERHYEWAKNPSDKDKASFVHERFESLMEEGILQFTNGNGNFDDEIELLPVNGHTFSQQLVKLSDSSQTLLYCGDLVPTSSHVPIPYVMGFDLQPLVTIEEKKEYFQKAVDEEWKLFFEHDPQYLLGKVGIGKKGFELKERYESLDG